MEFAPIKLPLPILTLLLIITDGCIKVKYDVSFGNLFTISALFLESATATIIPYSLGLNSDIGFVISFAYLSSTKNVISLFICHATSRACPP